MHPFPQDPGKILRVCTYPLVTFKTEMLEFQWDSFVDNLDIFDALDTPERLGLEEPLDAGFLPNNLVFMPEATVSTTQHGTF